MKNLRKLKKTSTDLTQEVNVLMQEAAQNETNIKNLLMVFNKEHEIASIKEAYKLIKKTEDLYLKSINLFEFLGLGIKKQEAIKQIVSVLFQKINMIGLLKKTTNAAGAIVLEKELKKAKKNIHDFNELVKQTPQEENSEGVIKLIFGLLRKLDEKIELFCKKENLYIKEEILQHEIQIKIHLINSISIINFKNSEAYEALKKSMQNILQKTKKIYEDISKSTNFNVNVLIFLKNRMKHLKILETL